MRPELFGADLERKPDVLRALAESLRDRDPWLESGIGPDSHLVLVGMGSSHYANSVVAARLRAAGVDAVAELASSDLLPAVRNGTIVIAVSASGGSVETLDAVDRYDGRCPIIAMTNVESSPITTVAAHIVSMHAEPEVSGVSCRSFQNSIALLLALESRLVGGRDIPALVDASADATVDLLERRDQWLPRLLELAIGPMGTYVVAPARRFSSAQQGALMLRETPRLTATGCETGDWSHVDVYLTKTTDYRLVLFTGSRWEPALCGWVAERGSTLIAVGGAAEGAALSVRYAGDDDDDVRLLAEVLTVELLADALG